MKLLIYSFNFIMIKYNLLKFWYELSRFIDFLNNGQIDSHYSLAYHLRYIYWYNYKLSREKEKEVEWFAPKVDNYNDHFQE